LPPQKGVKVDDDNKSCDDADCDDPKEERESGREINLKRIIF